MSEWIFTFGCGQKYEGHRVRIKAETSEAAREKMCLLFGNKWSMQYSQEDWIKWLEKAVRFGFPVEKEMRLTNFQMAKLAIHDGEEAFAKWLCDSMEKAAGGKDEEFSCDDCPFTGRCSRGHMGTAEWLKE